MSRVQNNNPTYTNASALTHDASGGGAAPEPISMQPALNFSLKTSSLTQGEPLAFVVPAAPIVPFVVGGTIAHLLKILHGFKQHPLAQPLAQSLECARVANQGLVQLMKQYQAHASATRLRPLAQPHMKQLTAARNQLKEKLNSPQANNLPLELSRTLRETLNQVNGWVATGEKFMAKLARPTQASATTEVGVWEKVRRQAGEQGDAIATRAKELGLTPERVEALLRTMNAAQVLALLNDINLSVGGGGRGGGGARVATGAAPNDSPIERIIRTVEEGMKHAGGTYDPNFNAREWVLRWLASPNNALDGQKPEDYLGTQAGVDLLLNMIGAMFAGSYF
jgi:hypothetical protein